MGEVNETELLGWLSDPINPAARYITARTLLNPRPSERTLDDLHQAVTHWDPLRQILEMQNPDGSFPSRERQPTARATFWALRLMARCGLDMTDEPVVRAIDYLTINHLHGALSYTAGGSGVLPCYLGVTVDAMIRLGALETDLVQWSLRWLIDHQRFDHKSIVAGGTGLWPYRAPDNFGCWESVSCYHGVAAAFRAFAAVPASVRSPGMKQRLQEAIDYLEIHRLYKKSAVNRPLFRHMTQFSLVADYRSDLVDMLSGIAAADPRLISRPWVRDAVAEMDAHTVDGRVVLVKNYGKKLADPIPFEPLGKPSRFLTVEWLVTRRTLEAAT